MVEQKMEAIALAVFQNRDFVITPPRRLNKKGEESKTWKELMKLIDKVKWLFEEYNKLPVEKQIAMKEYISKTFGDLRFPFNPNLIVGKINWGGFDTVNNFYKSKVPSLEPESVPMVTAVEQALSKSPTTEQEEVARHNLITHQALIADVESKSLELQRTQQEDAQARENELINNTLERTRAFREAEEAERIANEARQAKQKQDKEDLLRKQQEEQRTKVLNLATTTPLPTTTAPIITGDSEDTNPKNNGGVIVPDSKQPNTPQAPISTASLSVLDQISKAPPTYPSIATTELPSTTSGIFSGIKRGIQTTLNSFIQARAESNKMITEEIAEVRNDQPITPAVQVNNMEEANNAAARTSLQDLPPPPSMMATVPQSMIYAPSRFNVARENEPEEMIQVPVEPAPSSAITYTNKTYYDPLFNPAPKVEQPPEPPASEPPVFYGPMTREQTIAHEKIRQGNEPWWMRSENAPRADITRRFGDYAIMPTRSPLTSTDKAVGILPFPEAFEPWKYSMPRPYSVEIPKVNQYTNYPRFHLAKPYMVMVNSEKLF